MQAAELPNPEQSHSQNANAKWYDITRHLEPKIADARNEFRWHAPQQRGHVRRNLMGGLAPLSRRFSSSLSMPAPADDLPYEPLDGRAVVPCKRPLQPHSDGRQSWVDKGLSPLLGRPSTCALRVAQRNTA